VWVPLTRPRSRTRFAGSGGGETKTLAGKRVLNGFLQYKWNLEADEILVLSSVL
jgi:hypothetical protein